VKRKTAYLIKIHHKLPVPVKAFDKKAGAYVQQRHVNYYLSETGDYTAKREQALVIKSKSRALAKHKKIRAALKGSHLFGSDDFVSIEEKFYFDRS
jgi:hypothetical protein